MINLPAVIFTMAAGLGVPLVPLIAGARTERRCKRWAMPR